MGLLKTLVLAGLIFIGGLFAIYIYAQTDVQTKISQAKLWDVVQEWRISQNKEPYKRNKNLCTIADERIPSLREDWSHNGFVDGLDKYYAQYPEFSGFGENIARGFDSEDELLNGWLNSRPHLEVLESDFTHSCIRCGGVNCVQIFGAVK